MRIRDISIIALIMTIGLHAHAQHANTDFFDSTGSINYSEMLTNDLGYSLTHIDSRAHDVVWAHITYRIIDLRENTNAALTYPIGHDSYYKNLFKVIAEAVADGVPVYYPNEAEIIPAYDQSNLVAKDKLSDVFFIETFVGGAQYVDPLFDYDSIRNRLAVNNRIYDRFNKGVNKFLIQEVFFFDTHLSRMNHKIIGIAPMMLLEEDTPLSFSDFFDEDENDDEPKENEVHAIRTALRESVVCWLLYDDLKEHFSKQIVFPESNEAEKVTFHELFVKKMYSSYLVGDNNLMKKMYSINAPLTIPQLTGEINEINKRLIELESQLWMR